MDELSDRELLDLAMKAMNVATAPARKGGGGEGSVVQEGGPWNPLESYSQALQLASALGIDYREPRFLPDAEDLLAGPLVDDNKADQARACRAIVLAAAEQGEALVPITCELLKAIRNARNEGQEVVSIKLFATAWGELHKESSGRIAHTGEYRTFDGIPMVPDERNPISPRFVLETK